MSALPSEQSEQLPALTPEQLQLVTFFAQWYGLHGDLPSAEMLSKDYGIPIKLVQDSLKNEGFIGALRERGINFDRFSDSWTSKSLTPEQLVVANCLLDLTDQRSNKKKLQDLGVSTATYQSWLKDPVFTEYIHTRAEQSLGENKHEVNLALLDKVRAGDLKAIAYFNEMTGRFIPQRANAQNFDVHQLIVKIIEIIDMNVTDHAIKFQIANDIKRLIAANNAAAQLTGSGVVIGTDANVKDEINTQELESPSLEQPEVVETNDLRELGL